MAATAAAAAWAFRPSAKATSAATAASAFRAIFSALAAFAAPPSAAVLWQETFACPFVSQLSHPRKSKQLIYVK